jgi:integrase
MAEGIRKRHSKVCNARQGKRCNCKAGWEARVYLPGGGKRIEKTFKRESEAKGWRAEALRAVDQGSVQFSPRSGQTLTEALSEFVEGMKAGSVRPRGRTRYKPNTVRSYERAVRVYIAPSELGAIKVAQVRRRDVQEFVDAMYGRGLSGSTVSNTINPIQAFYRRAVHREEATSNPSAGVDLAVAQAQRPKRIASREEATALLAVLKPLDQAVWATAFYAGLRRGEVQALRVCDVDFAANLIAVERGWDQEEGVIEPKSRAGRRTVPLLSILREHLDAELKRNGRSGEDLIFGRTTREAFFASTIDHRAKRAWARMNEREQEAAEKEGRAPVIVERITMHECRHTFASLLIDSGANAKAIQQFMGHAKIQTTFDVYGHLLPGSHDEVRRRMDAYLRGETDEGDPGPRA